MKKYYLILFLLLLTLSFSLEFNISVNYHLKAGSLPKTIVYPLNIHYLLLKGYITLTKKDLKEPCMHLIAVKYQLPTSIVLYNSFSGGRYSAKLKKRFLEYKPLMLSTNYVSKNILSINAFANTGKFAFRSFVGRKHLINFPKLLNLTNETVVLPKATSKLHFRKIKFKFFFKYHTNLNIKSYAYAVPNAYEPLILLKNFGPKMQKTLFSDKNSKVYLSYGDGYNFNLNVSFPLSINYDGNSFDICSEYGSLTMESTHLYYSYSLFYKINNSWFLKGSLNTKTPYYSLSAGYNFADVSTFLGVAYNGKSFLPLASVVYNDSSLTFVSSSIDLNFRIPNFEFSFKNGKSISYACNFNINNFRFIFGYNEDLNFLISTGFDYYLPLTCSVGYNKIFFVNFELKYSDFDFGYSSLKNRIYFTINKNL